MRWPTSYIDVAFRPKRDSGGSTMTISRTVARPTFDVSLGEGRTAISSTAGIDYVSTFEGEGV